MDDSRELFDEIVGLFKSDAPPHLQAVKDGLANNDKAAVMHGAHALKGMVGVFAADRTMHAAATVEQTAGTSESAAAIEELINALAELEAAIAAYEW